MESLSVVDLNLIIAAVSPQEALVSMFLPFRNLSNAQSAGYGVLCLVLIGGIKWLDANMPVTDPFSAQHDKFAWSDMDDKGKKNKTPK